jgi:hypothetical protein
MAEAGQSPVATGCIVVVLILGALIAIGKCSGPSDKAAKPFVSPSLGNQIEAMATTVPVQPLNTAAMRKGNRHLKLVLDAQGLSGAMVYSQNCYDAVSRNFSWTKLDTCGAFDMLAVKAAAAADTQGLPTELEYFGPEAAAGRYLAVATQAGEEAGEADKRLEALQRKTPGSASPAAPKATRSPEDSAPEPDAPLDNDAEEAAA